eukprot:4247830-Ditylum_brightwellii.AAC.2
MMEKLDIGRLERDVMFADAKFPKRARFKRERWLNGQFLATMADQEINVIRDVTSALPNTRVPNIFSCKNDMWKRGILIIGMDMHINIGKAQVEGKWNMIATRVTICRNPPWLHGASWSFMELHGASWTSVPNT